MKYSFLFLLFLPLLLAAQSENEPNNTFATANAVPFSSLETTIEGTINPDQDDDYFELQVNQPGVFIITVSNIPTGMNPASNQLTLDLTDFNLRSGTITIRNAQGQLLYEQSLRELRTLIEVSTLTSGMYFIEVNDGQQQLVGKFIRE